MYDKVSFGVSGVALSAGVTLLKRKISSLDFVKGFRCFLGQKSAKNDENQLKLAKNRLKSAKHRLKLPKIGLRSAKLGPTGSFFFVAQLSHRVFSHITLLSRMPRLKEKLTMKV